MPFVRPYWQRIAGSIKSVTHKLVYPILNHPLLAGLSAITGVLGFFLGFFEFSGEDDPYTRNISRGLTQLMVEAETAFEELRTGDPDERNAIVRL